MEELMSTLGYILTIGIGSISIGLNIYFGVNEFKAKRIMSTLVESYVSHSQTICDNLKSVIDSEDDSDRKIAKVEGIYPNIANLNGKLIRFFKIYYRKKLKKRNIPS